MRKRLTAVLLLCVLSAFLPACQPQEPESGINIVEEPVPLVNLSMFVPVGVDLGGTDSFQDLTMDYNEQHSTVQVVLDSATVPEGYDRFLEKRLNTVNAVDVFVVNAENVKVISQKGQFYDLSGLQSFKELTESAREQAVVDETAYTIPLKMAVYVLDVNVSVLEQYGLDVPQNFEEFIHCCQVLEGNGATPIAINRWWSMAVPVMARSLYPIYQSENKDELIRKLNSGELMIGDYMLEGFRMFEYFLEAGYYGDDLVMEEVDAIKANTKDLDDFKQGKAAFRFCPVEAVGGTHLENGEMSVAAGIPMLPDGTITLPSISVRLCVNANSTQLEESIAYVDYLASRRVELLSRDKEVLSPFHRTTVVNSETSGQEQIFELLEMDNQIPLEDMNLHFGCWENTRKLCLEMIGGLSAEDAAEKFNQIQMEELEAYTKADK